MSRTHHSPVTTCHRAWGLVIGFISSVGQTLTPRPMRWKGTSLLHHDAAPLRKARPPPLAAILRARPSLRASGDEGDPLCVCRRHQP